MFKVGDEVVYMKRIKLHGDDKCWTTLVVGNKYTIRSVRVNYILINECIQGYAYHPASFKLAHQRKLKLRLP